MLKAFKIPSDKPKNNLYTYLFSWIHVNSWSSLSVENHILLSYCGFVFYLHGNLYLFSLCGNILLITLPLQFIAFILPSFTSDHSKTLLSIEGCQTENQLFFGSLAVINEWDTERGQMANTTMIWFLHKSNHWLVVRSLKIWHFFWKPVWFMCGTELFFFFCRDKLLIIVN